MPYTYRGYTLNSYKDYPNFAVEAAKDQAILALLPPNGSSYVSTEHYHARLSRPTAGTPVVTVDDTGTVSFAGYGVGYMHLGAGGAVSTVTGVYGITGSQGSQGATGIGAGSQGATGLVGSAGATGAGSQGATGLVGSAGATGARGNPGNSYITGPQNALLRNVNNLAFVCTGLQETGSNFVVNDIINVNSALVYGGVADNAGNPYDGGSTGAPTQIDVSGKSIVRVAPSSDNNKYFRFLYNGNYQEITVINDNYTNTEIPAIIQKSHSNISPLCQCDAGKALKLIYEGNQGTNSEWISVQDSGFVEGPISCTLREGSSTIIAVQTGYAVKMGKVSILHLPDMQPSDRVPSIAPTYWILLSHVGNGYETILPVTSGKDVRGWFWAGADGVNPVAARFIVYNTGIYIRKEPDDDWNQNGTVTGMVGFNPCVLTWTNE